LAAKLKQANLNLDVATATAYVGPWLYEVANQRIHGTTGEKPSVLLEQERFSLQPLPERGSSPKVTYIERTFTVPIESFQHPLSIYDQLLEVRL